MNVSGFRVTLNLCQYYQDHRAVSCIFLSSKIRTIADLHEKIASTFDVCDFYLTCQDKFLPQCEDIRILDKDDSVCVVPLRESINSSINPTGIDERLEEICEDTNKSKYIEPITKQKKRKIFSALDDNNTSPKVKKHKRPKNSVETIENKSYNAVGLDYREFDNENISDKNKEPGSSNKKQKGCKKLENTFENSRNGGTRTEKCIDYLSVSDQSKRRNKSSEVACEEYVDESTAENKNTRKYSDNSCSSFNKKRKKREDCSNASSWSTENFENNEEIYSKRKLNKGNCEDNVTLKLSIEDNGKEEKRSKKKSDNNCEDKSVKENKKADKYVSDLFVDKNEDVKGKKKTRQPTSQSTESNTHLVNHEETVCKLREEIQTVKKSSRKKRQASPTFTYNSPTLELENCNKAYNFKNLENKLDVVTSDETLDQNEVTKKDSKHETTIENRDHIITSDNFIDNSFRTREGSAINITSQIIIKPKNKAISQKTTDNSDDYEIIENETMLVEDDNSKSKRQSFDENKVTGNVNCNTSKQGEPKDFYRDKNIPVSQEVCSEMSLGCTSTNNSIVDNKAHITDIEDARNSTRYLKFSVGRFLEKLRSEKSVLNVDADSIPIKRKRKRIRKRKKKLTIDTSFDILQSINALKTVFKPMNVAAAPSIHIKFDEGEEEMNTRIEQENNLGKESTLDTVLANTAKKTEDSDCKDINCGNIDLPIEIKSIAEGSTENAGLKNGYQHIHLPGKSTSINNGSLEDFQPPTTNKKSATNDTEMHDNVLVSKQMNYHESRIENNSRKEKSSSNKEQCFSDIIINHEVLKSQPILTVPPKVGDIVSFKVMKLNDSYCPEISSYITGKVLNSSESTKELELKILDGLDQCLPPEGKFSMDLAAEDEEETNNEEDVKEFSWEQLIEPKMMYQLNS